MNERANKYMKIMQIFFTYHKDMSMRTHARTRAHTHTHTHTQRERG